MAKFMGSNETGAPLVHFEFDNGWTLSLLRRWEGDTCNCAVAAWPTARSGKHKHASDIEHFGSEMSDNEVAKAIHIVSSRTQWIN